MIRRFIVPFGGIVVASVFLSCQAGDGGNLRSFDVENPRGLVETVVATGGNDPKERVQEIEQIVTAIGDRQSLIPPFLSFYVAQYPRDPYDSYYYYLVGRAFETMNQGPQAVYYYRRSLHTGADVIADGDSVQYRSIQRLLQNDVDAYEKVSLYEELLSRFHDKIDLGNAYYFLGRAEEEAGQYQAAFDAYGKFLQYPGTVIPGKTDEQQRIKEMLAFAGSSRDWTRPKLEDLIADLKTSLNQKDATKLLSLQAKVNFFSRAWLQDEADFNSQVNYDLKKFLLGSDHVYTENMLEGNSNSQEAYLKSWGWSSYLPTWLLYFRRVNFPADPEVNGNWEWAGIFFGDSLQ